MIVSEGSIVDIAFTVTITDIRCRYQWYSPILHSLSLSIRCCRYCICCRCWYCIRCRCWYCIRCRCWYCIHWYCICCHWYFICCCWYYIHWYYIRWYCISLINFDYHLSFRSQLLLSDFQCTSQVHNAQLWTIAVLSLSIRKQLYIAQSDHKHCLSTHSEWFQLKMFEKLYTLLHSIAKCVLKYSFAFKF